VSVGELTGEPPLDPASLEAVHRRLDLAYTTLMDAAKRKDYDSELFPDGVPMPVSPPVPPCTPHSLTSS